MRKSDTNHVSGGPFGKGSDGVKRLRLTLVTVVLLFSLCGCVYEDAVVNSLPDYENAVFYTSGGFQDYTDYAKYSYESVTIQDLKESGYFRAVTPDDMKKVLSYIENFEGWAEGISGELKGNYDFDKTVLSQDDFFYIETKGEGTSSKFDDYTVYYFDMGAQILYYFHNNV